MEKLFYVIEGNHAICSSTRHADSENGITLYHEFSDEDHEKVMRGYGVVLTKIGMQPFEMYEEVEKQVKTPIKIEKDGKIEDTFLVRSFKVVELVEKEIEKYTVKIIETESSNFSDKKEMIFKYKDIQKDILEIKAEIQDYEEELINKTPQGQILANARIKVLKERLALKRAENDTLATKGVEKFGMEIISEF